jgi:hypothetical protein
MRPQALYKLLTRQTAPKSICRALRALCKGRTGYSAERALTVQPMRKETPAKAKRGTSPVPGLAEYCQVSPPSVFYWMRSKRGVPKYRHQTVLEYLDAHKIDDSRIRLAIHRGGGPAPELTTEIEATLTAIALAPPKVTE